MPAHPYVDRPRRETAQARQETLDRLNAGRYTREIPAVRVGYYLEVESKGAPMGGLEHAARMILEHGTVKPWDKEGPASFPKPPRYDENMGWTVDIGLYSSDTARGTEEGRLELAYPLYFFDKSDGAFPLAQLFMAFASEPASAFSFYHAARVVSLKMPEDLTGRLPPIRWPHNRVRSYLGIGPEDPIIGTIIKPKTGLTPELFSMSVVEAATAGARFTKADENCHLTRRDLELFVRTTVRDLERAGFDLGAGSPGTKPRFLFAPHVTAGAAEILERCRIAVEAGANALMFSPYYVGGFETLARIAADLDVPLYAHTAGMNQLTGSWSWGFDPAIMYQLAARFGAAFMQITCASSYLRPLDVEKPGILATLEKEGLSGENGMTLVVAGGLGPDNIGRNMAALGWKGRMYLAGTSVYSHPAGPGPGVKALISAYRAYRERGITDLVALRGYAADAGADGIALRQALDRATK